MVSTGAITARGPEIPGNKRVTHTVISFKRIRNHVVGVGAAVVAYAAVAARGETPAAVAGIAALTAQHLRIAASGTVAAVAAVAAGPAGIFVFQRICFGFTVADNSISHIDNVVRAEIYRSAP